MPVARSTSYTSVSTATSTNCSGPEASGPTLISQQPPPRPPFGFVYNALGTRYVVNVGDDAHVYQLYFPGDNGGWQHNDLTKGAGAPGAACDFLAGYVFAGEGTLHVAYIAENSVWELCSRVVP